MHADVKDVLHDILLDMSDEGLIKFENTINSHDFIEFGRSLPAWYHYGCSNCKYSLEDICWVNLNIWSPITCDEAKIKRALE
jgi:hypothetical protein